MRPHFVSSRTLGVDGVDSASTRRLGPAASARWTSVPASYRSYRAFGCKGFAPSPSLRRDHTGVKRRWRRRRRRRLYGVARWAPRCLFPRRFTGASSRGRVTIYTQLRRSGAFGGATEEDRTPATAPTPQPHPHPHRSLTPPQPRSDGLAGHRSATPSELPRARRSRARRPHRSFI